MKNFCVYLLLFIFPLYGQVQEIVIQGVVKDKSGQPLQSCNIYLEGALEGAVTDSDGYFRFSITKAGPYQLVSSYIGYQTYTKQIELLPGESLKLNIIMAEMSISSQAVNVTASVFSSGEKEGVTLTPLEVVGTPGAAADIFWAIKTFPGVQQVEEGAGLFVRGGDVSETIVVLDGAYLSHPYRYESPNGGFFGTITPFLLRETFFSSGGFSAEYGNALSGALTMESVGLPVQRQFTLGMGLAATSGSLSVPIIPEKLGFSASGNYSSTERMFKLNGYQREFSTFPESYDINFNSVYRYSPEGSFKFFLFREVDKVGIELVDPDARQFYQGNGQNNLANLRWRHVASPKLYLTGNLAFNNFEQSQNLGVMDLSTDERLYQFRLLGEYKLAAKMRFRGGVETFRNQVLVKGKIPEDDFDLDPNAPILNVDTDYNSDRGGVFSELQINLNKRSRLITGLRLENDSQSGQQFVDPRLSLSFGLKKDWSLVFSTGRYHQFPRPDFYDPFVGNPRLKAMEAWHYIAGIVKQTEKSIFRTEVYYKDYRKLLLDDPLLNYTNQGDGYAAGVDVFIKRDWNFWKGWISYSYLDAGRFWEDAPQQASPEFDITHSFTGVLEASFSIHLSAGLSYRYATGKPYTSAANRYHDQRTPDYHKLDANISYLRSFFPNNLTVFYLAVSNILGRENIFGYSYSDDYQSREPVKATMLRSVYFGVSVNF